MPVPVYACPYHIINATTLAEGTMSTNTTTSGNTTSDQQAFEQHSQAPAGRFANTQRDYSMADVQKLSGSIRVDHTLARHGADKLWHLLATEDYVPSLGAMTGNQAMQMVRAGLKAIYLSGWQVAADANTAGGMYPDQSLYPADSGPELARRINRTLQRCDQIQKLEGEGDIDWFARSVIDSLCQTSFTGFAPTGICFSNGISRFRIACSASSPAIFGTLKSRRARMRRASSDTGSSRHMPVTLGASDSPMILTTCG